MPSGIDYSPRIKKVNKLAAKYFNNDIEELISEGFPGYMCYSFLETAKATNSIILSRLPGGVGTDLIEEGYDLKGFHIKAKSCNWGPMAGFICQLPLFNKQGMGKVSYNTNEIGHYIKNLKKFSETKNKINHYEAERVHKIAKIDTQLPEADKITLRNQINKQFDALVLNVLKLHRKTEETTGEWTGENAIEGDSKEESPYCFIPLQRKFESLEDVRAMRGIVQANVVEDGLIYGIAQNVTDEPPETNKPTVIMEFLLQRIGDRLWQMYHGRIKYKNNEDSATPFNQDFTGKVLTAKVEEKVRKKYAAEIDSIFRFDLSHPYETSKYSHLLNMCGNGPYAGLFPPYSSKATFYRVRGFVNPFPPFKRSERNYYKNAVSGDYDLFAVWPSMKVDQVELIRQSELTTGRYNRIGGKIFTTYFGNKCNLGVEFVPGFSELNPNKDIPVMKESAEFGNMNSLVHLVSGRLNSFAASFISEFNNLKSAANKGFHSDEGGRPGIMEIEFPIAVFMPQEFKTKIFNNKDRTDGTKTPLLTNRIEFATWGGLIKSADELVAFILECMDKDYRVFLHYRWLIHLLFNTLDRARYDVILWQLFIDYRDEIARFIPGFEPSSENNLKEFKAINVNRAAIDRKMEYDVAIYAANIKKMLTYPDEQSDFIKKLTEKMLVYSLLADKPSFDKKTEIEGMMNRLKINTRTT